MSFNARLDAIEKNRPGAGPRRVIITQSAEGRSIDRRPGFLGLTVPYGIPGSLVDALDDEQRALLRPDDDICHVEFHEITHVDRANPQPFQLTRGR